MFMLSLIKIGDGKLIRITPKNLTAAVIRL